MYMGTHAIAALVSCCTLAWLDPLSFGGNLQLLSEL